MDTVPIRIYNNADDLDIREIELYENLHREDLTPYEEVMAKKAILEIQRQKYGVKSHSMDDSGVSMRDVASLIGDSRETFRRDVELANAMTAFPDLAKAKTKSEARSLLNKLERKFKEYEAVSNMEKEDKADPKHDPKVGLRNGYIVRDFFEGIAEVGDGIVDIVECDWPYGIDLKDKKKRSTAASDASAYNEIPSKEYPSFIAHVFKECYRVMKKDSWMIVWFGVEPWFEVVYQAALAAGFTGRRLCGEWIKPGPGQSLAPLKYLSNQSEWFFYFAKGHPELHIPGRSNIFLYPPVSAANKTHDTERPVEMIQDVLDAFCYPGALVLVPFLGSGNTLLAANNLNMKAFGYDLEEEFRNSYLVKVSEGEVGKFRSYK